MVEWRKNARPQIDFREGYQRQTDNLRVEYIVGDFRWYTIFECGSTRRWRLGHKSSPRPVVYVELVGHLAKTVAVVVANRGHPPPPPR